jgi:acyl-CoA reductase-like NAD-dependent aldehyde dehydrogenase
MSPWNYPVNLAVVPLAGAIAAGNTVFVKLSRHAPYTSALLGAILQQNLDPESFVIEWEGGREMISSLLEQPWDHIFFTGSVDVGKKVMKSAAEHLASVTLELGGKVC